MSDSPLDVQISLVNTNNRYLLARCLASLPAACEDVSWRATVVDNASDDGSAEMVRQDYAWARLIVNDRRRGFSVNHNQVIVPMLERGATRYVLVLNEDTELSSGAVRELVRFCDGNPRVGAAGPTIRLPDGEVQPSYQPFPTIWRHVSSTLRPGRAWRPNAAGWLNASCVLLRVESLRQVGSLDDRFFIFFEDADLGFRLWRAGWESAVVTHVEILHHEHHTVSRPTVDNAMDRQMLRSAYLYFSKHRGLPRGLLAGTLARGALRARALKAFAAGVVKRDGSERRNAAALAGLARYNPREPLDHELRGKDLVHAEGPTRSLRSQR
jgi:N-acetylglucosaminyl-diphospho-decaprenol L-rhamnosyltransferase